MFQQLIDLVSGAWWTYPLLFAVAYLDAIIPLVPSETMVITAGVLASAGDMQLGLIIVFAAAGAFCGDNTAYFIGHRYGDRVERRFFSSEKAKRTVALGRTPARRTGRGDHHRRPLHPRRPDGGHAVRRRPRDALAAVRDL